MLSSRTFVAQLLGDSLKTVHWTVFALLRSAAPYDSGSFFRPAQPVLPSAGIFLPAERRFLCSGRRQRGLRQSRLRPFFLRGFSVLLREPGFLRLAVRTPSAL